jgi:branched-chain amino acid transport system permease protein
VLARNPLSSVLLLLLLALAVLWPSLVSVYWVNLMTTVLIYGLFVMSVDFLLGYAGSPSFGQAAFFGLGAYAVALFNVHISPNLWLNMLSAIAVSAAAALVIGLLVARTSGMYFLMLTLAFAQLIYSFAISGAGEFAGGYDGLPGVARPTLDPLPFTLDLWNPTNFYFLSLAFLLLSLVVLTIVVRSPFGKALVGIRENEPRMRALGYVTWRYRLMGFVVAGAFGGIAGGLFAWQRNYVSPSLLSFTTSGIGFVMVIVGGAATLIGPVFGAAFYVFLQDYVSSYTPRWGLIFGAVFVLFVFVARDGLAGLSRRVDGQIVKVVRRRR